MKQKSRLRAAFLSEKRRKKDRRKAVRFRLLCVKGFASVRSTLAGLAERGSETAKRLESKKKQSLTACGGAPFTQGSLKTSRQPKFLLPTFLFKEKYGAYFSFQRKVRSKKVRGVYINRYKRGGKATAGGGSGRRTMQNKKFRCKRRHYARKFIEALLF